MMNNFFPIKKLINRAVCFLVTRIGKPNKNSSKNLHPFITSHHLQSFCVLYKNEKFTVRPVCCKKKISIKELPFVFSTLQPHCVCFVLGKSMKSNKYQKIKRYKKTS